MQKHTIGGDADQRNTKSLRQRLSGLFNIPMHYEMIEGKRTLVSKMFGQSFAIGVLLAHGGPDSLREAIQLIVALKKAKLAKEGIRWEPGIISLDDLNTTFNALFKTEEFLRNRKARKQLVSHFFGHFFAMDVEAFIGNDYVSGFRAVVIDPAQDFKTKALVESLKKERAISELYEITGVMQHDDFGCAIVATNIIANLRRIPNLFELLAKLAVDGKVHYSKLPICVIKNMQSLSDIDAHGIDQHTPFNKKGESLAQFVDRHCGFFSDKNPTHKRNFSVVDLYRKNSMMVNSLLSLVDDNELQAIVDGTMLVPDDVLTQITEATARNVVIKRVRFTTKNIRPEHLTNEREREFFRILSDLEVATSEEGVGLAV